MQLPIFFLGFIAAVSAAPQLFVVVPPQFLESQQAQQSFKDFIPLIIPFAQSLKTAKSLNQGTPVVVDESANQVPKVIPIVEADQPSELEAVDAEVAVTEIVETEQKNGAAENGAVENGAAENGAVENGAAENGAVENGAAENGAAENGAAENGAAENGAAENGVAEYGAAENGAAENGAAENGAAENGAAENGAAENGAAENGAAENGNGETVVDSQQETAASPDQSVDSFLATQQVVQETVQEAIPEVPQEEPTAEVAAFESVIAQEPEQVAPETAPALETETAPVESVQAEPALTSEVQSETLVKTEEVSPELIATEVAGNTKETAQEISETSGGKSLDSFSSKNAITSNAVITHFGFTNPSSVVRTYPNNYIHHGAIVDPRTLVPPQFSHFIYQNDSPEVVAAKINFFRIQALLTPTKQQLV